MAIPQFMPVNTCINSFSRNACTELVYVFETESEAQTFSLDCLKLDMWVKQETHMTANAPDKYWVIVK